MDDFTEKEQLALKTIDQEKVKFEKFIVGGSSSSFVLLLKDKKEGREFVRKISIEDGINGNGIPRIRTEARFLKYLQDNNIPLSKYYPKIYDVKDGGSFCYYDMEYISNTKHLADSLELGELDYVTFNELYTTLLNSIIEDGFKLSKKELNFVESNKELFDSILKFRIGNGLNRYFEVLSKNTKYSEVFNLMQQDTINIDGVGYKNPFIIINEIADNPLLQEVFRPRIKTVCAHGDLTFNNVIYDTIGKKLVLLDPKGLMGADGKLGMIDPLIDFGKLKFGVSGSVQILGGSYNYTLNDGKLSLVKSQSNLDHINETFFEFLEKDVEKFQYFMNQEPYWKERILLHEASHFLAFLQYDVVRLESPERTIPFFMMGTIQINKAYNLAMEKIREKGITTPNFAKDVISQPSHDQLEITKAVILAAGQGSRLRPITNTMSKPMAPVINIPLLEHMIFLLKSNGITKIIICYSGETKGVKPQEYFRDGKDFGVDIKYFKIENTLGTGGTIYNVINAKDENGERLIGENEHFIKINGDIFVNFDLTQVINFHKQSGYPLLTMITSKVQDKEARSSHMLVINDATGKATKLIKIPSYNQTLSKYGSCTGTYILSPHVFKLFDCEKMLKEQGEVGFLEIFPLVLEKGGIYAKDLDSNKYYWYNVDDSKVFARANLEALSLGCDSILLQTGYIKKQINESIVYLGKDVKIGNNVKFIGRCVIGHNTIIRDGATIIGPCIIGNNNTIPENIVMQSSITLNNVCILKCPEIQNSIICEGVSIQVETPIKDQVVGESLQRVIKYPQNIDLQTMSPRVIDVISQQNRRIDLGDQTVRTCNTQQSPLIFP